MVDVFLSYSRRDQAMVAKLARAIEAEGYAVWWDAELPPHQSYGDVITAKIAAAKAAVVVWSADAIQSEWVRAEADMARNQRKLIQTSLDNAMPPLPFNQIQYADLSGWNGEADQIGWRKVKASLAELCGVQGAQGVAAHVPRTPPAASPVAPSVPREAGPPVAAAAPKWPLFAGLAVGAAGLAAAAGFVLGGRGTPVAPPAASSAPAVAAAAPELEPDRPAAPLPPAGAPFPPPHPAPPPAAAQAAPPVAEPAAEPEPGRYDMTFPDSSRRLLTEADVAGLGPATLRYARNEIYARHGRRFRDPELRAYFSQFPWYRPVADEVALNPVEKRNIALIQGAEAKYR